MTTVPYDLRAIMQIYFLSTFVEKHLNPTKCLPHSHFLTSGFGYQHTGYPTEHKTPLLHILMTTVSIPPSVTSPKRSVRAARRGHACSCWRSFGAQLPDCCKVLVLLTPGWLRGGRRVRWRKCIKKNYPEKNLVLTHGWLRRFLVFYIVMNKMVCSQHLTPTGPSHASHDGPSAAACRDSDSAQLASSPPQWISLGARLGIPSPAPETRQACREKKDIRHALEYTKHWSASNVGNTYVTGLFPYLVPTLPIFWFSVSQSSSAQGLCFILFFFLSVTWANLHKSGPQIFK